MDKNIAYYIARGTNADLATAITATRFKFRDEFGWNSAELSERYDTTGSTVLPVVSSDRLTLSTGVAADAICQALLPLQFTSPAQVVVAAQFSQANPANCDVSIELVDGADQVCAAFVFPAATTATQARAHTFNKYSTAATENTTNLTVSDRVTAARLYQIQLFPDEIRFAQRDTNSVNGRNTLAVRTFRVPDPDEQLSLRIKMVNGASAPATSTDLRIFSVSITDINELPVDMTNTGGSTASETIPVNVVTSTTVSTVPAPSTSSGSYNTFSRVVTAATTNATSTKNALSNFGGGSVLNTSAAAMYFKLFNKASAPTVGTDTPILTVMIPANSQVSLKNFVPSMGMRMSTGLAWCLTANPLHTDTTAVAAGSIVELIYL